ncbi:peptidylprolyl isomerase [Bacteriovoracales bacterium]|nr:peptidylprolyl isomerase [Bacteriovoracales bacterium]
METIVDGHVVEMNYTLINSKGDVIDSSSGKAPLAFIQGKGDIVPGLEKEMAGKKVGDSFKVTISPEEAYGTRNEGMVQSVAKEQFGPEASNVEVGMQFQLEGSNGQTLLVTAIKVEENEVILDGNHPLAGETLSFDIEVVSLRDATKEELEKGNIQKESESCSGTGCC